MDFSWEFFVSAAILIFLARSYQTTIYYLKFMYYYGVQILVVTLLIPYFALRPRNVLNFLVSSAGCRHVSKVIGIKWTLRGAEHLSKDQACVIVANHQSSLDVQGMMDVMWPVIRKMTVIAKRELLFVGSFGISMFLAGLTFINRSAGGKAGQAMNEIMEKLKKEKTKLWVFPEGTRNNTGKIHEFKKGAFHAAIQAQVPIVPVVFSSYKHFLDTKNKTFSSGEIIITALPEIPTEGLTAANVDDLIQHTRMLMIKTYDATSKETEANSVKAKED